jgi:hypothetical protein
MRWIQNQGPHPICPSEIQKDCEALLHTLENWMCNSICEEHFFGFFCPWTTVFWRIFWVFLSIAVVAFIVVPLLWCCRDTIRMCCCPSKDVGEVEQVILGSVPQYREGGYEPQVDVYRQATPGFQ